MLSTKVWRLVSFWTAKEKYLRRGVRAGPYGVKFTCLLPLHPPILNLTFLPHWCVTLTKRDRMSEPYRLRTKFSSGSAKAKSIQSKREKSIRSGGKLFATQPG